MKPVLAVAFAALALVVALALWFARGAPGPSVADAELDRARESTAPRASEDVDLVRPREAVIPARAGGDAASAQVAESPAAPQPFRAHGSVCDVDGLPVARVPLADDQGAPLAVAGADGRFDLDLEHERLIVVRSPAWVTLRAAHARATNPDAELRVVVAPKTRLVGRVVDTDGAPVAGATLTRQLPDALFARIPFPLDHSSAWFASEREAESDAAGRFAFESFPAVAGAELAIEARGYRVLALRLDEASFGRELVVTLSGPPPGAPVLEGWVRFRDGSPAVGASVRYGSTGAQSDAHGAFRLTLTGNGAETGALIAVLTGRQPAVRNDVTEWLALPARERAPLELVIGPPALSIQGRVLDPSGAPAPGWHVELEDGTVLGADRVPPEFAEAWVGGAATETRTDAAGRFTIGGLGEREYRLLAWDERTLVRFESPPLGAGARGVELRAPADGVWPKLAGRVLDPAGRPIASVHVQLGVTLQRVAFGATTRSGAETVTDVEGRYAFTGVAWRDGFLSLDGEALLPNTVPLSEDVDREQFDLRLRRRVDFRVETSRPSESQAERVEFVDAAAAEAAVFTLQSSSWSRASWISLANGRSQVHALAEGSYTLVFLRDDGFELLRRDVEFVPGDVQVVEY